VQIKSDGVQEVFAIILIHVNLWARLLDLIWRWGRVFNPTDMSLYKSTIVRLKKNIIWGKQTFAVVTITKITINI